MELMTNGHRWIMVAALCFGLTGCFGTYSWNQKITIYVQTPEGMKSGSGVTSIKWWDNFFSGGWGGARKHSSYKGTSAIVDFGDGRYLFQIMHGGPGRSWTRTSYVRHVATESVSPKEADGYAVSDKAFERWLIQTGEVDISEERWPFFATFSDLSNPKSVEQVTNGNIHKIFGTGFKIIRVTIARVQEEPDYLSILRLLPWLTTFKGRLDGSESSKWPRKRHISNSLVPQSFFWKPEE